MSGFLTVRTFPHAAKSTTSVTVYVSAHLRRCFRSGSNNPKFGSSDRLSPKAAAQGGPPKRVGVFWNLDSDMPPQSFPYFRVANSLKVAASSFGKVQYMVAYGSRHAITHPRQVPKQSEDEGKPKRVKPTCCGVCGRRFYDNERLLNHFSQVHEREYLKRLNEIDSAKGKKRVNLVGRYSVKMDKYRRAARDLLSVKEGNNLEKGLERAGFWVRSVSNIPQAAIDALRAHMVDMMDKKRLECVFLVSSKPQFVDVLKEARLRRVHTVVVGRSNGGALRRTADAALAWKDIMSGSARTKAEKVLRHWKDSGILKRLEWTYNSETDDEKGGSVDQVGLGGGNTDIEDIFEVGEDDFEKKKDKGAWWELD